MSTRSDQPQIEAATRRWRAEVARDRHVLYRYLGPQIRTEAVGPTVTLVAFGESKPVSFGLNTVERGVIRIVPGITDAEVDTWLRARSEKPFADVDDFVRRAGLRTATLASLRFK